jgi:transposase
MRQASKRVPDSAEKTVRDIRRATRRHHSAEDKIRIVLEGLRGEDSIADMSPSQSQSQAAEFQCRGSRTSRKPCGGTRVSPSTVSDLNKKTTGRSRPGATGGLQVLCVRGTIDM